jgi:hypothetical protein
MIFWCILIIICSISHGQLETNIFMVRIRPRIHDLTMNADKQWSAIKVTKDTMPQVGIHLVGMVLHSLVVAILLLQIVAFIPNLFTKHLPVTWSLAAKVTGCKGYLHQLLLILCLIFRIRLTL